MPSPVLGDEDERMSKTQYPPYGLDIDVRSSLGLDFLLVFVFPKFLILSSPLSFYYGVI